jgi:hypothetical protein
MFETQECHRCDRLAENPSPCVAKTFGQVRAIVLCLDCLELMFSDNPEFLTQGWLKYRPGGLPA